MWILLSKNMYSGSSQGFFRGLFYSEEILVGIPAMAGSMQ
jgi:hypothetical protein